MYFNVVVNHLSHSVIAFEWSHIKQRSPDRDTDQKSSHHMTVVSLPSSCPRGVCIYIYIYIYIYIHLDCIIIYIIYIYIWMYACIYIYIYTYIHTYSTSVLRVDAAGLVGDQERHGVPQALGLRVLFSCCFERFLLLLVYVIISFLFLSLFLAFYVSVCITYKFRCILCYVYLTIMISRSACG